MLENLNWYPGHMKKTRELISNNLKLVDGVIEVLDGRIPLSSRNPIINDLVGKKDRIIVLNKEDLCTPYITKDWEIYFKSEGAAVLALNSMEGRGIKNLFSLLEEKEKIVNAKRSVKKPFRLMIVGIPNVGKSSLINRLTGKKVAQIGDRPGVTKGKQWLTMKNGMQLLDTPGILWPKFENKDVGVNLGFCGSIKDEIMPLEDLAFELIGVLMEDHGGLILDRYGIDEEFLHRDTIEIMDEIAMNRGFIRKKGLIDYERTARTILDEFRAGIIGKITLERPHK